ncbi:MAG: AraC family transcriptional regulator [Planctomycetota bacterium]
MIAETPLSFGQSLRQLRTDSFQLLETRHPQGMCLSKHAHGHACVNFVLEGCYREDIGNLRGAFLPRQAAFKPPGAEHANHFETTGARCLLVELVAEDAARAEFALGDVVCTARPAAARAALALWHELARTDASTPLAVEHLGWELYAAVLGVKPPPRAPSTAVRRACEALHDDPRAPWTLATLATHVGLHPSHLARAFRAAFDATVGDYLRALRVDELARHLALERRPVAELADDLGFADQSHATRAFRARFATTPAAWRRAFR